LIKKHIKYKFGSKLRAVRERKNITLKQVAGQANVSESLVSQIERNRVSPSIDTLLGIADVLGIDYEYLFSDYKQDKGVSIVRVEQRKQIVFGDVVLHQLSNAGDIPEEHDIEAFNIEIDVGAEKGDIEYGHVGKELGIILNGSCELVYGSRTYELSEGDSIGFPSDIPHILRNTGDSPLKAIWVITPPRMMFQRKT